MTKRMPLSRVLGARLSYFWVANEERPDREPVDPAIEKRSDCIPMTADDRFLVHVEARVNQARQP